MESYTFTSESVCAGHPDKVCDQISDAIVDAVLGEDPSAHTAIEVMAGYDKLVIMGEVSGNVSIDYKKIAQSEIQRLGYTGTMYNFSNSSPIDIYVHTQSEEIAIGVKVKGAGDQGMMFGYACNETDTYMPLPIAIAHSLAQKIDQSRESKKNPFLRPDGKTQVTIEYRDGVPYKVKTVVIAVPHTPSVSLSEVKESLYTSVVKDVLTMYGFSINPQQVIVNGTGVWHNGGPASDAGLTGRKIVVDTYGGYARVGGGCFSGKDPSKVDRSGAYAARFIAKNIVAQKLASKAEVRLAYVIGHAKPIMQEVETFNTLHVSQKVLKDFIKNILDTSVEGIINGLNLRRPIYLPSAAYGHFGRDIFPWEQIKG